MDVTVTNDGCRVIQTKDEIDLHTVGGFRAALEQAVKESPKGFVVDLSGSGFIDSSGLAAVVAAYRSLHAGGGKLALVSSGPYLKRLLDMISLTGLPGLYLEDSLEAAKAKLCGEIGSKG